jgi:hypothetical protein
MKHRNHQIASERKSMLRYGTKYKEVVFGVLFGAGASLIDAAMHATMGSGNLLTELFHPTLVMMAYRILFLAFGVSLGVLLWLRNRRERDFRELSASLETLRGSINAPALLLHVNLQVLLMHYETLDREDVLAVIRTVYEGSTVIQHVLHESGGR